ncbi:MAG TPA: STAS domain-containing protein [Chloroflexia bacterium]|nr:STAS domain-containing protein [Chloroflexia bacterium]
MTVQPQAAVTILEVRGDVTMDAEGELATAYETAIAAGAQDLILSLAGTEYMSSGGIAVITNLVHAAQASGRIMKISGLNPHYQKIFRMMGLAQYCWDPAAPGDYRGAFANRKEPS